MFAQSLISHKCAYLLSASFINYFKIGFITTSISVFRSTGSVILIFISYCCYYCCYYCFLTIYHFHCYQAISLVCLTACFIQDALYLGLLIITHYYQELDY